MQAIALSSRKRTTFFFLIGTGKIKTRQKSTHVDVTSPHPYGFITAGHHLVNSFLRVNIGVGLIHIADLNGFIHLKGSLINLFLPHNHTKQRGFSGSVGTNNPNNTVGWQSKLQTFKQQKSRREFAAHNEPKTKTTSRSAKQPPIPTNNHDARKPCPTSLAFIPLARQQNPLENNTSYFSFFCPTAPDKRRTPGAPRNAG